MAVKTIVVKGQGIRKELIAGGAVTPGHLVMRNSSNQVVVHNTAKGVTPAMFAVENEVVGQGIDTAYAQNDTCHTETLPAGAEVNAIIAASQSIAIGDYLESAGDGTLRELTAFAQSGTTPFAVTTQGHAIARAVQAVTTTGTTARCIVEIL